MSKEETINDTSNLGRAIRKNPLQAITVAIALVGVVFSVFNFYLLSNIAPLERRVAAVEKIQDTNLPYVTQFVTLQQSVIDMKADISEIKDDLDKINLKIDKLQGL